MYAYKPTNQKHELHPMYLVRLIVNTRYTWVAIVVRLDSTAQSARVWKSHDPPQLMSSGL